VSPIDPTIHQALDGEIPRDALALAQRREADALDAAVALLATAPAGVSVEQRVMAAIQRPAASAGRRLLRWAVRPHSVVLRMRPVWSLALAASLLLLAVLPSPGGGPQVGEAEGIAQFVGRFPGARSVNVVGSFNDWGPVSTPLEDRDHDGVWQAVVVLPTGTHEYMFVVDGERWVVDPLAGRFVEDGFGRENSVLIVRPLPR
jgi:Glycogen recognition site of AMP-activated protein kinase